MASDAHKRLMKEMTLLSATPVPGVRAVPDERDMMEWTLYVEAPATYIVKGATRPSPWAGLTVPVKLHFPSTYPHKEPTVEFEKGQIYHPGVQRGAWGARAMECQCASTEGARGPVSIGCVMSATDACSYQTRLASALRYARARADSACPTSLLPPASQTPPAHADTGELCGDFVRRTFSGPSCKVSDLARMLLQMLSEPPLETPLDPEAAAELSDDKGPGIVAFEKKARAAGAARK